MRTLGIITLLAWLSVGTELLFTPPAELAFEIETTKQFLSNFEKSPLKGIPEFEDHVAWSQNLLADPSARSKILWIKWVSLTVLVALGCISAYALFRTLRYAHILLFLSALLFLARQAIFHPVAYDLLFQGMSPIPWLLQHGHYILAASGIWYNLFLPAFFIYLTIWSAYKLAYRILIWRKNSGT